MPRFTPVQAVKASLYSGLATAIGAFIMNSAYYFFNIPSGTPNAVAGFGYLVEFLAGLLFSVFIVVYFALTKRCEYVAAKRGVLRGVRTAVSLSITALFAWFIEWLGASLTYLGKAMVNAQAFASALAMFIGLVILYYCSRSKYLKAPLWISVAALIASLPLTFIGIALDAIAFAVALKNIGTLGKA